MHVGFTGTQVGTTEVQRIKVIEFLESLEYVEALHHGDCYGADSDIHGCLADDINMIVHPGHPEGRPRDVSKRAFCLGVEQRPTKPYLDRNQDIVDESDVLIACPKTLTEEVRSGTWATVRRARKRMIPIFIVDREGNTQLEGTLKYIQVDFTVPLDSTRES